MTPKRIQRKRTKGWRKPENTICVSRPSKWGSPFKIGMPIMHPDEQRITRETSMVMYRAWLGEMLALGALDLSELRGKNLACWCRLDQLCHADILLELTNERG